MTEIVMSVDEGPGRRTVEGDGSGEPPSAAAGARLDDLDPVSRAREICLHQLTTRARSRAELATVLARRGVTPEIAEVVLDRLAEVGLIDDQAFASAVVASGRASRGLARRALAADLRRRGVDDQASAAALAAVAPEDELASARELVQRRLRGLGSQPPHVQARRLTAMLARKGYPSGLASQVVRDVLGGDDDTEYVDGYVIDVIADNDL